MVKKTAFELHSPLSYTIAGESMLLSSVSQKSVAKNMADLRSHACFIKVEEDSEFLLCL
jgi:hypothetical protein